MSDLVDLGNEKAYLIEQGQITRSSQTTNVYAIAYCSGDGQAVVEVFSGSKDERLAFMEAHGIVDPVVNSDWAICQWNPAMQSWGTVLPGNDDMERKLQAWVVSNRPPLHLR